MFANININIPRDQQLCPSMKDRVSAEEAFFSSLFSFLVQYLALIVQEKTSLRHLDLIPSSASHKNKMALVALPRLRGK